MKQVDAMLIEYLSKNNYDGLCNPDLECGCSIYDLAPCHEISEECRAAYKHDDGLFYPYKQVMKTCSFCKGTGEYSYHTSIGEGCREKLINKHDTCPKCRGIKELPQWITRFHDAKEYHKSDSEKIIELVDKFSNEIKNMDNLLYFFNYHDWYQRDLILEAEKQFRRIHRIDSKEEIEEICVHTALLLVYIIYTQQE